MASSITQKPICPYCESVRKSWTNDPCQCAEAQADREAGWADMSRQATERQAQSAAREAKQKAKSEKLDAVRREGWADLRRQAAEDQDLAARTSAVELAEMAEREERLKARWARRQKEEDARFAQQGEDAPAEPPNWEAFEDARLIIEVDPNKVRLPAIMERTDLKTILYAECVNYIASRPNGAKTWLAIKAMVQGSRLGGRYVILDYDMKRPDTLARRALAMGLSELFKDTNLFYYSDLEKWENPAVRAAAAEWLRAAPNPTYSAVIIDTDTSAGAANDGGDIRQWWTKFITPWELLGFGVIVLAHLPKADKEDEPTHGPMGSQDKRGKLSGASYRLKTIVGFNADQGGLVHMILDKDKHGQTPGVEGEVVADVVFQWIGAIGSSDRWLNVTIEPHDEHRQIEDGGTFETTTEALYNALAQYPDGVYSQKEVKKLVKGNGKLLGESLYTLIRTKRVVALSATGKQGKTYVVDLYDASDSSDSSDSRIADS